MTRVLLLLKGLGRGGAEQLLVSSAPYYDRDAFAYEAAYLLPHKDALVQELEDAGVPVTLLGRGRGVAWIPRLRRLVRDHRIDIVHVHSPYAAIGARIGLVGRRRPRIAYTEHGIWPYYKAPTRWANMLTYGLQDHVFAVSAFVHDAIRRPRWLRALRMPPVETLHHGVDPAAVPTWGSEEGVRDELGIPDGAVVVGTVANFRPQKRLDVLVRAAAIVRDELPDVRFVLVGQGPLESEIRELVRSLGVEDTVVFAGFRDDAPRVMKAFDVFVLASSYEGLSIAMLEAMTLERPMVLTDVGGIREVIVDDVHARLVPTGDERALAAAIIELARDDVLAKRLGAGAGALASEFSIPRAVHRQEQVYRDIVAR